jgi:hypothetical protein
LKKMKTARTARPQPRLALFVKAAIGLALACGLSGCATNTTGFDFPSFGLTNQEDASETAMSPNQMATSRLGQP